jgi:hypothetical protein
MIATPFVIAISSMLPATPASAQCSEGWVPGIGAGSATLNVFGLTVISGTDVVVGGNFAKIGGVDNASLIRVNPTTNTWSALGLGTNGFVRAIAPHPNGNVYFGGGFTKVGGDLLFFQPGADLFNIASYNTVTGGPRNLGPSYGPNGNVNALLVLPGQDLIAAGNFSTIDNAGAFSSIARFNPTTGFWSSLGTGVSSTVYALALLQDGDVVAGGFISTAGGAPVSFVARYKPSTNAWSPLGAGVNGTVEALAVLPSGDLIVGGTFNTAGGVSGRNNIARYNPTTGVWSALGSGALGTVYALAVLPDGNLVVGGTFTSAGGSPASRIAQVNPATGTWSALGSGTNGTVRALAILPGGDILAGGDFSLAGGSTANRIARYTKGTPAPSITSQPLPVAVASGANAIFAVGATSGSATSGPVSFQWRKGGVAINALTNPSAATSVLTLTNVQLADVGSYDCQVTDTCGGAGTLSNAVALSLTSSCLGDLNNDGVVNTADLTRFLGRFGNPCQ